MRALGIRLRPRSLRPSANPAAHARPNANPATLSVATLSILSGRVRII